jgi:hypothetical protein
MTREAVADQFTAFVDDVIAVAREEFDVAAALGGRGPGTGVVDRLLRADGHLERRVVRPELEAYRRAVREQFDVVLDYADADADIAAFRADILDRDVYADAIREDLPRERRRAVEDALVERQRRLGEAVVPLVESTHEEFWPAARAELDAARARELVEKRFAFTAPLREHTDAFVFRTTVDPGEVLGSPLPLPSIDVEYTGEARRVMRRAERAVVADALDEIDRRFE